MPFKLSHAFRPTGEDVAALEAEAHYLKSTQENDERFARAVDAVCLSYKVDAETFLAWLKADGDSYQDCYRLVSPQRACLGKACHRWKAGLAARAA